MPRSLLAAPLLLTACLCAPLTAGLTLAPAPGLAQQTAAPAQTPAQTPADMAERRAQALALFQLTDMAGQLRQRIVATLLPPLEAQLAGMARQRGKRLNPDAMVRLREDFVARSAEAAQQILPQMADIYAQALSLEDLRWLNELYSDPRAVEVIGRMSELGGRAMLLVKQVMSDDQGRLNIKAPADLLID